jgi:3',5'-cyclic AMP phosphodiesterase CpdA
MRKIIHLTDLHLCPPGGRVVGFEPESRLRACIASINSRHADADLCVVTGDLTDAGDAASYERLRGILAELRVPVRLLLGNHDRRAAFRAAFPEAECDPHGYVQSVLDLDGTRLMFLDTLDESQPGAGILCRDRLGWVADRLAESGDRAVTVFLHHPPFAIGVEYFGHMLLANGAELMGLLRGAGGRVRHLAFGHCHVGLSGQRGGLSFSANRGTCHPIDVELRGLRALYVDRRPTYDVLLLEEGDVVVHGVEPGSEEDVVAEERAELDGGSGVIEMRRPVLAVAR